MTCITLVPDQIFDLVGDYTPVLQGQVPRDKNGVLLLEKEYVATSSCADSAMQKAVQNMEADRRGEELFLRQISMMANDGRHTCVIMAALRIAPMDFSDALRALKKNKNVFRAGWNGKGMHVSFYAGTDKVGGYFIMHKPDGFAQPGWVPSVGDLTADDWESL